METNNRYIYIIIAILVIAGAIVLFTTIDIDGTPEERYQGRFGQEQVDSLGSSPRLDHDTLLNRQEQMADTMYQDAPDEVRTSIGFNGSPDTAYVHVSGEFVFNETGHLEDVVYDDEGRWEETQEWLKENDFSFWGYEFNYGPSAVVESFESGKPRVVGFTADEVYMTTSGQNTRTEVGLGEPLAEPPQQ